MSLGGAGADWLSLFGPQACFLGSFVGDMGDRITSSLAIPPQGQLAAWSQKRSRTWPHRMHCVSWSRKRMRRRCCKVVRVRSASQSRRGESVPPTSEDPALGTWCNSREIWLLEWHFPSRCPEYVHRTSWTSGSECVTHRPGPKQHPPECCGRVVTLLRSRRSHVYL